MTERKFNVDLGGFEGNRAKLSEEFLASDGLIFLRHNVKMTEELLVEYLKQTGNVLDYYCPCTTKNIFDARISESCRLSSKNKALVDCDVVISDHPVQVRNFNGDGESIYAGLVSKLLSNVVGRKIILSVPHGDAVEMSPRGAFQIYVWSSPDMTGSRHDGASAPSYLWDYRVGCRDAGFTPSHDIHCGVLIESDGYPVAQVCSNALYIFHDAVHKSTANDHAIFALILKQTAVIMETTDFSKLDEQREAMEIERNRESARKFAEHSIPRQKSRVKAEEDVAKAEITKYQQLLYTSQRNLANIDKRTNKKDAVQAFFDDYDKLQGGFAGITRASFSNDRIEVTTAPIISTDKKTGLVYDLGVLTIGVRFGESGRVTVRSGKEMRIPHVGSEGEICAGTMYSDITDYIANYEILTVVSLLISFFERGVDTDDEWGQYLKKYPQIVPLEIEAA